MQIPNGLSSQLNALEASEYGAHLLELRCQEKEVEPGERSRALLVVSLAAILVKHIGELLQVISVLWGILLLMLPDKAQLGPQPILGGSSDLERLPTNVESSDNLV